MVSYIFLNLLQTNQSIDKILSSAFITVTLHSPFFSLSRKSHIHFFTFNPLFLSHFLPFPSIHSFSSSCSFLTNSINSVSISYLATTSPLLSRHFFQTFLLSFLHFVSFGLWEKDNNVQLERFKKSLKKYRIKSYRRCE